MKKYKKFWIQQCDDFMWIICLDKDEEGYFNYEVQAKQAIDDWWAENGLTTTKSTPTKTKTKEPEQPEPKNRRVDIGEDD